MWDISAITEKFATGASGLLTATEIAKNLRDLVRRPEPDIAAIKQQVVDLYDHLIDAKDAQMDQKHAIEALKRELQERDEFQKDLARYDLTATGNGAVLYTLKHDDERGEPPHHICPACVAQQKKLILQPSYENSNFWHCSACKATFPRARTGGGRGLTTRGLE